MGGETVELTVFLGEQPYSKKGGGFPGGRM